MAQARKFISGGLTTRPWRSAAPWAAGTRCETRLVGDDDATLGGFGSGWQGSKKATVEGSIVLFRDTDNAWLRLHYRANGEAVDYKVQLVTTKPNYGGRRWWFICPIVRRDGGKLYLPPGSKYFGSREAYGLTYTSRQESGKSRGGRAD
jgi:hypothetical protein